MTGDARSHGEAVVAHTPGPWEVDKFTYWITASNVAKGPMHVADIRGWGYLTGKGDGALGMEYDAAVEVQKANARLIAAAPDMLDALRNVQKLIAEAAMTGFNYKDGDWPERLFASQQVTSAAIESATGHRRISEKSL
jgi:hypothetical protein